MPDIISEILKNLDEICFLGNSLLAYMQAAGIYILGYCIITVVRKVILKNINSLTKKTAFKYDDIIVTSVRKHLTSLAYFLICFFALNSLQLSDKVYLVLKGIILIITIFFVIRFIQDIFMFWLNNSWFKNKAESKKNATLAIVSILKIVLWIIGFLIFLDNMGIKISAFIAGLGIGGIAIAFAAQAILGEIFSYFSIFFDNPFEIGDLIIIGGVQGYVEHIGIKTTRLRSVTGEEVVISNSSLTSSQLHNFKRMKERRINFTLGLTYDTPYEKLKLAPELIKEIVESTPNARFSRSHFLKFGDSSYDIETVYYVLSNDYASYCDVQQTINLAIKKAFDEHGMEFAFPTQTIYIQK